MPALVAEDFPAREEILRVWRQKEIEVLRREEIPLSPPSIVVGAANADQDEANFGLDEMAKERLKPGQYRPRSIRVTLR